MFSLVIKVNANQEIILLGGYSLESSNVLQGKALSREV
ncbi:glycerol-3-phosphate acyltransferase [Vibrio sp. MED222]|nr:glycerol-3-phosphate acyltransferase [Vibrio sp. MED222]